VKNSIARAGERIGALEQEPAKKWKAMSNQILALATSGIAGAIITAAIMLLRNSGA